MLGFSIGRTRRHSEQRSILATRLVLALPLVLVLELALASASANAATIMVDTQVDDVATNANCTLREAIIAANTNAAVDQCTAGEATPVLDRIEVPAGTYDLTVQNAPTTDDTAQEGDLDILEEVIVVGAGMNQTIIDGQAAERVFDVQSVITILTTLQHMEIRNGNDIGGGGILNIGSLQLDYCRVTDNISNTSGGPPGPGGGIRNLPGAGSLLINDSEISDNQAQASQGGGIAQTTSNLMRINRSTISGNSASSNGGGITATGPFTITNSTISGNSSGQNGGAITATIVAGFGGRRLINTTVYGNTAPGGFGTNILAAGNGLFFEFTDSIVVGEAGAKTCHVEGGGSFLSHGGNFESPGDDCNLGEVTDTPNSTSAQLALSTLADFGGPTPTHGPLPGSVVIDTAVATCEIEDQRGELRDDGMCDSGAVEIQSGEDITVIFAGPMADFEDGTFGDWTVSG
jgi:CSLREA domain-containing protein